MMVNGVAPAIPSEIEPSPQNKSDPSAVNLSADFSALLFLVLAIPQAQPTGQNGTPQLSQAASSAATAVQNACAGAPLLTTAPAGLQEIISSTQALATEQTGATAPQANATILDAAQAAGQLAAATPAVAEAQVAAALQAAPNLTAKTNESNETTTTAEQKGSVGAADSRAGGTPVSLLSQSVQNKVAKSAAVEDLDVQQGQDKPAVATAGNHTTATRDGISSMHAASEARLAHEDLLEKHNLNELSDKVTADLRSAIRDHSLQPDHSIAAAIHSDASKGADKASATVAAPVINRVASEIALQVRQNKNQALITLDPPDLGSLRIALTLDGDKVQARIVAELHESGNLIQNHLPELKDALQFHRLDLVDVHIDSGNWGGAHNDFTQNFGREFSNQDSWQGRRERAEQVNDAPIIAPSQPVRSRPGRVSMWA